MVWEGREQYSAVENALQDLESGLAKWMLEQGFH